MMRRRTLASVAEIEGVGLFTSRPVRVRVHPAQSGGGLHFVRADLATKPSITATIDHLATTPVHPAFAAMPPRSTALANGGARIDTVEHILSALVGLGVTDARLEVHGPELPIGDGSAAPFTEAIAVAGLTMLDEAIEPLALTMPICVEGEGGASILAEPAEAPSFTYSLDYGAESPIVRQDATWTGAMEEYQREVAPARTFCLVHEAVAMRQLGLFDRFSPRDLLVFGADGPIDNTLRWPNEPARHKLLDLIGDLALVGRPIAARITAHRSGHALNHELARRLFSGG